MTGKDKILSRGSGVHAEINIVPVERNNIKECNLEVTHFCRGLLSSEKHVVNTITVNIPIDRLLWSG